MTPLGPHLSTFLREHLPRQRQVSVHTCDTYAYAFQLLLGFAARRLHSTPSALAIEQLDGPLVLSFLEHLETERRNSPRTRNARLAAIKSFFRFVKKTDEALVGYLSREEIQALLDAPDPSCREGLRDRAMLYLAFAAGLRVSELVGLCLQDLVLQPHPTIHVVGKGRRERVLPLWKETVTALRGWLGVRGESTAPELFLNARGVALTRSGFEYLLAKHVRAATAKQPSLATQRISPHSLRHSCAMHTLQATGDIRKVALWLGHASLQSTEAYLRANPSEKLEALASLVPPSLRRGHFRPPDKLLAMLRPQKGEEGYAEP